ncbi:MAG: hypothetical protein AAF405_05505 [Pseudomonadota bacterium]
MADNDTENKQVISFILRMAVIVISLAFIAAAVFEMSTSYFSSPPAETESSAY